MENVKELRDWGPLLDQDTTYQGTRYRAGQPDPRRKGLFFNLWYREIKASGYAVDMRVLNAADYGAATSRERLIIQAVRKSTGERIIWPEPTHQKEPGLFSAMYRRWRPASEIIDWTIPGESIFDRRKPLCPNTLRRIAAGIERYWGEWAEPFLIILRGTGDGQLPSTAVPLSHPLPTLTAGGGHVALIRPFLTRYNGGEERNHGTDAPVPVIDCANRYGVIAPVVMDMSHPGEAESDASRCRGGNAPIGTITTRNNWGVAMPLFVPQQSAGTVKPVAEPLPTIATGGAIGLVEPLVLKYYGNEAGATTCDRPLDTITTRDRFGIVQWRVLTLFDGQRYRLDITHRMLTAAELARATSFPEGYKFCGGDTAAKKQIGNAVPPALAEALYRAVLAS